MDVSALGEEDVGVAARCGGGEGRESAREALRGELGRAMVEEGGVKDGEEGGLAEGGEVGTQDWERGRIDEFEVFSAGEEGEGGVEEGV